MIVDPRDFKNEYVDPAISTWQRDRLATHLAIHAITQVDNLAEVVFLWDKASARPAIGHKKVAEYRDDLGIREPFLAVVRDAHDSHKHGALRRKTATMVSQGQRPENAMVGAFFLDHTPLDGPLTSIETVVVRTDKGDELVVEGILINAMSAWKREFERLGL